MTLTTAQDCGPRPAGRPKDHEKRQAILIAAEKLFLREGFERATMDAVAKEANVSKITVYSHFDNKASLFTAMVHAKCDAFHVGSWGEEMLALPLEEAIYRIALAVLRLVTSQKVIALHRIIEAEATRHPIVSQLLYSAGPSAIKENFQCLLRAWCERGEMQIDDFQMASEHFYALLKGDLFCRLILNVCETPDDEYLEFYARSCAALYVRGYRPPCA